MFYSIKKIAFICFENFQILDLTGPMQVFESSRLAGKKYYEIHTLSRAGGLIKCSAGLRVDTQTLQSLENFDSMIIVGGKGTFKACNDSELIQFIKVQTKLVKRTISICTGSFILSKAGLLDGKKATTHWRYLDRLAERNPSIVIEQDSLYIRDKNIITSAGVTAGIDLALSLVEEDISREIAIQIARNLVIYYHRSGGQQQFSEPLKTQSFEDQTFGHLCLNIINHPKHNYTVTSMAESMNMSPRNFSRRFTRAVGISPGKYVEKIRLDTAKTLLENTQYSIENIAQKTGFSHEVLRRTFLRHFGITPSKHRIHFGTAPD